MGPYCCPCCWPVAAVATLVPSISLPAAAATTNPAPPSAAPAAVAVADPHTPPIPACMIVDGRAPAFEQGILRLGLQIGTETITPGQRELLLSLLPEGDVHKLQGFYHDKDRRLALGSLLLQRAATSWVLGQRFKDILIQRTQPYNKPYVEAAGTRLPGWNYNVSHHGDWVVLASEPSGTVGTDVVCLQDRPFQAMTASEYIDLFRRHLTPAERDGLEGLAPKGETAQYRAFFRVWAMKEAYIKALGVGLSFPIRRLECSILDVGKDYLKRVEDEGEEEELMMDGYGMADWKLRFLALPPDGCYLWCTAVGPAPSPHFQDVGGIGGTAAVGISTVDGDCNPCNGYFSTVPFSAAASQDAALLTATAAAAATKAPASGHTQQRLRRQYHVLSIRDILPWSVQAEWDASGGGSGSTEAAAAAAVSVSTQD